MSSPFADKEKYAVCLTFDFDALSLWIGTFGVRTPGYLSRGEFGARVGVPRILKLLDQYGIKSTFFVPGHTARTYPEVVEEIFDRGHEIAHHGDLHEGISKLKLEEERKVIRSGITSLEAVTGQRPLGFRSPSWEFSNNTIGLLLKEGFVYDSSLMGDDYRPYRCRNGDRVDTEGNFIAGKTTSLLEVPVSWSLDDWPHFEFVFTQAGVYPGLKPKSGVLENWQGDFDYLRTHMDWGVYTLTMHPQVMGRGHRMLILEDLVRHIKESDHVFFTTLIEVAESMKKAKAM